MKRNCTVAFVVIVLFSTYLGSAFAQDSDRSAVASFNDQGVAFVEQGRYWQAIQAFERAMRSGGAQQGAARDNIVQFRKEMDLPAHTLLHFGWINGIGQMANVVSPNVYFVLSILLLLAVPLLYFKSRLWSWKRVGCMVGLAVCLYLLGSFCTSYRDADNLVILKSDTDLKDKPYEVSGEKQVVFQGQMGQIEQTYEDYYLIQTDTYENGWVLREKTATIW